jgi:hypothetical protein
LGGKPLRCDGICLVFHPVRVEKAAAAGGGASKVNVIELTIEKKRPRTTADIKRTPFEEDNYLASAWSRPNHLPLSRGPRCLRVLGPTPQMIVTNMTDPLTGSKAIEGTVNRILIKLQAGPNELCGDIKFTVNCTSMLLSMDGTTTHLNNEAPDDNDQNNEGDFETMRTPSLVCRDESVTDQVATDFGYSLPKGWKLVGSGRGTPTSVAPSIATLKTGEETFVYFDLYRPHRVLAPVDGVDETGSLRSSDGLGDDHQLCQTDFDISISYTQANPKAQQSLGRRRRKPPLASVTPEDKNSSDSNETDVVSMEYTGSLMWTSPLSADFSCVDTAQKAPPAGSRHPSNSIPDEATKNGTSEPEEEEEDLELALVDGERVSTRCSLWSNEMPSDISIEVSRVWFEVSRVLCGVVLSSLIKANKLGLHRKPYRLRSQPIPNVISAWWEHKRILRRCLRLQRMMSLAS